MTEEDLTDEDLSAVRLLLWDARYTLSELATLGVTLATMERLQRAGLASPQGYWHLTRDGQVLRAKLMAELADD